MQLSNTEFPCPHATRAHHTQGTLMFTSQEVPSQEPRTNTWQMLYYREQGGGWNHISSHTNACCHLVPSKEPPLRLWRETHEQERPGKEYWWTVVLLVLYPFLLLLGTEFVFFLGKYPSLILSSRRCLGLAPGVSRWPMPGNLSITFTSYLH